MPVNIYAHVHSVTVSYICGFQRKLFYGADELTYEVLRSLLYGETKREGTLGVFNHHILKARLVSKKLSLKIISRAGAGCLLYSNKQKRHRFMLI